MKIATIISGSLAIAFVAFSLLLKAISMPGGSFLILVGAAVFIFIFSPLLMIYLLRKAATTMNKLVAVAGLLVAFQLGFGLLFGAMGWPGSFFLLVSGAAMLVLFGVLLFISARKGSPVKLNGVFSILPVLFYLLMALGWKSGHDQKAVVEQKFAEYQAIMETARREVQSCSDLVLQLSDPTHIELIQENNDQVNTLLLYINQLKNELVAFSNNQMPESVDATTSILHPLDYDHVTVFMVGVQKEVVTGKAKELRQMIGSFQSSLSPATTFSIQPVDQPDGESWEAHEFYHLPLIDALIKLTSWQMEIVKSARQEIEMKTGRR